jgi:hypothetical protein
MTMMITINTCKIAHVVRGDPPIGRVKRIQLERRIKSLHGRQDLQVVTSVVVGILENKISTA